MTTQGDWWGDEGVAHEHQSKKQRHGYNLYRYKQLEYKAER